MRKSGIMTSRNEAEKILKHRAFWKERSRVPAYTLRDLKNDLKSEFEYEKRRVEKKHPKRKIRAVVSPRKPPVKGAKKRAFEHYCGGEPKCFWPDGCDARDLPMLQLHHINGDGKDHRERLKYVAGNFYVALEIEGYPHGLKPLCANHHIMMHTKSGAYWEEYLS